MSERLSQDDFNAAGLGGWRVEDDTAIAELGCSSFTAAGELAAKVAAICDQQNHHADLAIRYPGVLTVTTSSHDVGGLTDRDLRLAQAISDLHPG
jgi:4a-hydroxytetrahydrobiopterin dehydratase